MPVDEHTITIDQVPVFFRTAPADGAPTLYLHGVPTSSDDFLQFLPKTGGIAPDLPGFGRSGKGGHLDYSLESHADFLEAFLAHLEIDEVKLVAHDWGAGAGLTFARRHPDRVQRLVLIDALPLLPDFTWHRLARTWRRPLIGELAMGGTTKWVMARILRSAADSQDAWPPQRVQQVWEHFDQGTQRAILRLHRGIDEPGLAAAGEGLEAALTMRTLILWGEDDPWFSAEFAFAYAQRLEHAELECYANAGHWPWLAAPEAIERVVAFLAAT